MSSRHLRDIHRGPSDSPIYIDIAGNSVSLLRPSHQTNCSGSFRYARLSDRQTVEENTKRLQIRILFVISFFLSVTPSDEEILLHATSPSPLCVVVQRKHTKSLPRLFSPFSAHLQTFKRGCIAQLSMTVVRRVNTFVNLFFSLSNLFSIFVLFFSLILQHPYPSEDQKKQLAQDTGLTILQVNNW